MKAASTLYLRLALVLLGLPVPFLCFWLIPEIFTLARFLYPQWPVLAWTLGGLLLATTLPFYGALAQAWKLLSLMEGEEPFTAEARKALGRIRGRALGVMGLYALALPLFYLLGEKDDAPGLILAGFFPLFAASVAAVAALLLERLLDRVLSMKAEQDLTI